MSQFFCSLHMKRRKYSVSMACDLALHLYYCHKAFGTALLVSQCVILATLL